MPKDETEILKDATEFRTEPHRTRLTVHLLEDKESSCFLWVESCGFYHTDHRVFTAVAVNIACLELIHGVG